jgi:hypothetical protein
LQQICMQDETLWIPQLCLSRARVLFLQHSAKRVGPASPLDNTSTDDRSCDASLFFFDFVSPRFTKGR